MTATLPTDPRQIGPYRVVRRLGAGGMGQVFLGRSPAGRMVAIKVIHPSMADDENYRARFRREITAARAVGGVYTAPVVDADPDASPPWLAIAFLQGMSLQETVKRHGPLPPPAVRMLGAALAEALRSIHGAGVVHRDLKPSNVMLTPEGPRVIDFGIARPTEATTLTKTGATLGTPAYMSPEQASGEEAGPASDIFSLGGVLTYAATGVGPFGQGAVHEVVYRVLHTEPALDGIVDPGLRTLVAACLEKDPARRPGPDWLLAQLSADQVAFPQGTHWLPPNVAHDVAQRVQATVPSGPSRRGLLALGVGGALAAGLLTAGGAGYVLLRDDGPALWTYRLPEGMQVRTRLVVHGGTVFVFASERLTGETVAIEARTGKRKWRGSFTAARDSSAAMLDGRGFVYDSSGEVLTGFDTATGRTLWTQRLKTFGLAPAPVASAGVVCLAGSEETGEYGVYAFDAASGTPRWRFGVDDIARSGAAVSGNMCYAATRNGFVHGIDLATGSVRWRGRTGAGSHVTPMVTGDLVAVLTQDGVVHGFDAADGRRRWRTPLGDGAAADSPDAVAAGVSGGIVFVAGHDGVLYAVDAATGRERWRRPGGRPGLTAGQRGYAIPSVGGGLAVTTDNEGTVTALDAATGRPRWERGVSSGLRERPLIGGSLVYWGGTGGLYVLDLATGRIRHRLEFEDVDPIVTSVQHYTLQNGTLYTAVDNSAIQALRISA